MRILVLGGSGMLGHKVFQALCHQHDCFATFRHSDGPWRRYPFYQETRRLLLDVDALRFDSVIRAFGEAAPEVVVNCIGVIKQAPAAQDRARSIQLNSLFPHQLASLCEAAKARLIHFSTDCVFSGKTGMYREDQPSDAEDVYGRSKYLGEVGRPGCVTLRTSIIGWDLSSRLGLLEWFRGNRGGTVRGFKQAIFSGLSTTSLARIIDFVISRCPSLSGVYHVASEPIDKNQLLQRLRDRTGLDIEIEPYDNPPLDRSLDPSLFRGLTHCPIPSWDEMIFELANERADYELWRKLDVSIER